MLVLPAVPFPSEFMVPLLTVLSGVVVVGAVGSLGVPAVGGVGGTVVSFVSGTTGVVLPSTGGTGTVVGEVVVVGFVVLPGLEDCGVAVVEPGAAVEPGVGAVEGCCAFAPPANIADTTSAHSRKHLMEEVVIGCLVGESFPSYSDGCFIRMGAGGFSL